MALTAVDRSILQRLLQHDSGAWNDFVDRFLGLVYHTIHYSAHLRSNPLTPELVEDIAQEVLTQLAANDYALLRQFRAKSSLATYLTVIARRISVRELAKRVGTTRKALPSEFSSRQPAVEPAKPEAIPDEDEAISGARLGLEQLERVQRLLRKLPSREREVVRLFYLEGRSFEEISIELNLPVKDIGPILKGARKLLRQAEGGGKKTSRPQQAEPK
jgi:RNA polymerase sigma-70 factor, ECF subfamily